MTTAKNKYRVAGEIAGKLAHLKGWDLSISQMRGVRNRGECAVWEQVTADGMPENEALDFAMDEYEKGWVRGWWGAQADATASLVDSKHLTAKSISDRLQVRATKPPRKGTQ